MPRRKKRKRRSARVGPKVMNPPQQRVPDPGSPASSAAQAGEGSPQAAAAEIGRYIAEGDTRAAVELAKATHRRLGTAESEAVLVDAYAARIEAMRSSGLVVEAESLTDLVLGRYACARKKLRRPHPAAAPQRQAPELLAGELADADLPADRRRQIEQTIRREATDLSRLAGCEALPADHPLRVAAAAAWGAFQAVTTGPVDDSRLELREVSRRSPLADWKLLVRAVASFYRRQDDACRRLLGAMDPASAAARLAGPLEAMLSQSAPAEPGAGAAELVAAVTGSDPALRRALEELEEAFRGEQTRTLSRGIRRAVRECTRARPDLRERLKQLISMRCFVLGYPVEKAVKAMGGPSRHDAHFWRLFARASEIAGDPAWACALWSEFRRVAGVEGWFRDDGPESVALHLHMIDLLRRIPQEELLADCRRIQRCFTDLGAYYGKDQPPSVRAAAPDPKKPTDFYFLFPNKLFRRVCAAAPDAAVYAQWMDHARQTPWSPDTPDDVAEMWHQALSDDSRPLLRLMASAEGRKAFTKALKYLQKAEALNALDPEVKRARLRLWVSKAIGHLRKGQCHLAEKDFEALEALPQSREGDRPALLAALRWAAGKLAGDEPAAAARRAELAGLFGGDASGVVLLTCIGLAGGRGRGKPLEVVPAGRAPKDTAELLSAVGRSFLVCREFGLPVMLFGPWEAPLIAALVKDDAPRDAALLRAVAEGAQEQWMSKVAFAAAGAGLRMGGPHRARFLLLRARSLRGFPSRQRQCLDVAAELARRQGETDLLGEVIDDACGRSMFRDGPDLRVDDEVVDEALERETAARTLPKWQYDPAEFEPAPPPVRRRQNGPDQKDLFEDFIDELFDDEDDEDDEGFFLDDEDDDEDEDDFEDDDEDDEDDEEEDVGLMPRQEAQSLLDAMGVVLRMAMGGKPPSKAELDRLVAANPELRERLEGLLGPLGPAGPSSGQGRGEARSRAKGRRRRRR